MGYIQNGMNDETPERTAPTYVSVGSVCDVDRIGKRSVSNKWGRITQTTKTVVFSVIPELFEFESNESNGELLD